MKRMVSICLWRRLWCAAGLVLIAGVLAAARQERAGPLTVGILPFDVASVEGGTDQVGETLAKLLRIEMVKNRDMRPSLLTLPKDAETPLSPERAAEVGRGAEVAVVVAGTVLEANTSQSSRRASTDLLGVGIGGSITRSSADVSLHVELVDAATGGVADTFEVESHSSGTGVGADFSTSLGSFDTGDGAWDKTPMGKALREAAQKLVLEVARRKAKLAARLKLTRTWFSQPSSADPAAS